MRGKSHGMWMSAQKSLASKRDSEQKLTAAGKTEKLPQLQEEISEVIDRCMVLLNATN